MSSDAFAPEPFQAARAVAFCSAIAASKPARSTAKPARAQRVLGQIVGEAEGVVELERGLAGQRAALAQLRGRLVEQLQPVGERLAEARLLLLQRRLDQRLRADQFGIGGAHLGDQRRHQPVHQRLLGAEQMRVAHRAAHDPAQHVAAALVRRQHAVGDQEAGGAQMIGDHAVARLVLAVGLGAGQRLARARSAP